MLILRLLFRKSPGIATLKIFVTETAKAVIESVNPSPGEKRSSAAELNLPIRTAKILSKDPLLEIERDQL